MAKQSSNKGKVPTKNMTKLIVPVKSQPQGTYAFKEEMILLDNLQASLKKYKA